MRKLDKQDLDSMPPEKLIELSENTTEDIQWERWGLYSKALEKTKALEEVEKAKKLEMEVKAFSLYGRKYQERERFCPLLGRFEGDFKDQFTKEDIMYYKERLEKTQNPILKARYADVIWELDRSEVKYAKKAIEEYLNCADLYFESGDDMAFEDSLTRSLSIALIIKQNVEVVVQKHLDFLQRLIDDSKRYRALMEVISSLLDRSTKKKPLLDLKQLILTIEKAIESYTLPGPGHSDDKIGFLERLYSIYRRCGDEEKAVGTRVRIAKCYEKYARVFAGPEGAFNRAHFLKKAMDIFLNLGSYSEEVNRLQLEIRKTNLEGMQAMRPSLMQEDRDINPPDFEKYINAKPNEIFELISSDPNLLPPFNIIMQITEQNASPLLRGIQSTKMQRELSHKKIAPGDENSDTNMDENLEFLAIQNFYRGQLFKKAEWLFLIFEILEKKNPHYINELTEYLEGSRIITKEKMAVIRCGLDSFAKGDYVGSIHIILFQIEEILRKLLVEFDISPTAYNQKTGEESEKGLFSILKDLYGRNDVDQDLLHFIDIFLCNPRGINYRDQVAHGILGLGSFNKGYALLLLLTLLKIAPYPKE